MKWKTVLIILIITFLVLLSFQSINAAIVGYTKSGYPACATLIDFQRMEIFFYQRDSIAMDKMVEQGRCIYLRKGVEVYAWKPLPEIYPHLAEIRLPGSTETLLTFWHAIEKKENGEEKKARTEEKSISFAPGRTDKTPNTSFEQKTIILNSLLGIKVGVNTREDIIQKYGEPFLGDREEIRYETGQHPDFKKWDRVKFRFDRSGVLKEIRAEKIVSIEVP